MNDILNYNAVMAWTAFGVQDFRGLENHGKEIYNYFVHHPKEILRLDSPLLIGKVFQVCLGFQEPDEDIQEVRAENAFVCFTQALNSDKTNIHDEAAARLIMLLINEQKHLINQVERSCQNGNASPYNIFGMLNDDMPNDMPMATNTKMLFTAYYLYDSIIDKSNVSNEFVNSNERNAFEYAKNHVLDNCRKLTKTENSRKSELGKIVFDKFCIKLKQDINSYSDSI